MSKSSDALTQWVAALHSDNVAQRRIAVFELAKLKNPLLVPSLLDALTDSDASVRTLIATALAGIGEPCLVYLRQHLEHEDVRARMVILTALRHMKGVDVLAELQHYAQDSDANIREMAQRALVEYGGTGTS